MDGAGDSNEVKARVHSCNRDRPSDSDWDREKLQERLATRRWLLCIKVGARNRGGAQGEEARIEMPSRHSSSIVEGKSRGGALAQPRCGALDGDLGLKGDEKIGVNIVGGVC